MAETSYAKCGDLSLAYQVFGDGPIELVFVGPFVTHVELFWTLPEFKAFFDQLATFCRVLVFDKAGAGLSDPIPKVRLLEERAAEIEAVMDAAGFGKPVLFGNSEGGPQAIAFAARRPERPRALILYGSLAGLAGASWDDLDRDPAELRARVLPEVGEKYTPSTEQIARMQEMGRAGLSAWGSGAALKVFVPSVRSVRQLAMFERMCASPGMVRATLCPSDTGIEPPDGRAADPADDQRAHPGHPCPRRHSSGAGRPLPRRPHPGRAVPRGRRRCPRALVHRPRHDPDGDRGVPHRQPRGTVAVPSRPAHRAARPVRWTKFPP
jgi:pimeloyl-ACP methyl ester carboxylesterase